MDNDQPLPDCIALARAGDETARHQLVERFTAMVRRQAARRVDAAYVDDVVQEVFIDVFATLHQLRTTEAFPAWLRLIVRKHADRHNRSRKRLQSVDEVQLPRDPAAGPADIAVHQDLARAVRAAMATISEPDRRVLELRYLADWSTADLAAVLHISEGAVRKRLHDARRRLKPKVEHLADHKEFTVTDYQALLGQIHEPGSIALGRVEGLVRPDPPVPAVTGIKIIDTIAPIMRGGTVELVGPAGTGHLVLVEELLYRLARSERDAACVAAGSAHKAVGAYANLGQMVSDPASPDPDRKAVFLGGDPHQARQAVADAAALAAGLAQDGADVLLLIDTVAVEAIGGPGGLRSYAGLSGSGGSVTAVLLDTYDREATLPPDAGLDTRLVFSVQQFALGIFPALDPVESHASFGEPAIATEVRRLLRTSSSLRSYFAQPFWVAEDYTGTPGVWVEPSDAETEIRQLLAG